MSASSDPQAAYYPIRVVSNETGVNAITLRAWERRYGLITPKRTAKGHRLYTEVDIQLIRKVVSLLQRGIPISQAKAMLEDGAPEPEVSVNTAQPSQWSQYRARLADAIQNFDDTEIARVMDEVTSFFPVDIALRFLLLPLHQQLREQITEPLGASRLQFFAGFLQGRLSLRLSESTDSEVEATLVLANTVYSDDLELLLIGILLKQFGIRVIRLAGLTTPQELSELIRTQNLQGAVVGVADTPEGNQLQSLRTLAAETGQLIFCTGQNPTQASPLRERGLVPLNRDAQQDALTVKDVLAGLNE
ncbi:MerR family transcriptional regulator [Thalassolituus sp.]|uniref:MerR family transcriptional regulator n=1 Tax=Thalassolituus sp. TaxID=2030822 RepID=UPI0035178738